MGKDPAFLFYAQDFIVGTAELSNEEVGQYIRILAYMHQKGRMTEKTIRLLVGSLSDNLRLKFGIDENDMWYNERLEVEVDKRANFVNSRRINGSKGGRPKKKKPIGKPTDKLPEDEDKDEIDSIFKEWAQSIKSNNKINKEISQIVKDYFLNLFPEDSDPQLILAWAEWVDYRRESKKKLIKSTATKQIEFLLSNKEPIKMMDQSIQNGWAGLFEVKNGTHKVSTGASDQDLAEVVARRFERQRQ